MNNYENAALSCWSICLLLCVCSETRTFRYDKSNKKIYIAVAYRVKGIVYLLQLDMNLLVVFVHVTREIIEFTKWENFTFRMRIAQKCNSKMNLRLWTLDPSSLLRYPLVNNRWCLVCESPRGVPTRH